MALRLLRTARKLTSPAGFHVRACSSSYERPSRSKISLEKPLPDLPTPTFVVREKEQVDAVTKVTTLSNGLRVASVPKMGQFCTVGVCIDSGARYEVAYPSGVSHFIEKLAFGTTPRFESRDAIMLQLEKFGGICDCQSTRDTFLYAASVDSRGLEVAVDILGEVVFRPKITDDEIEAARQAVLFELEDANMRPDQEPLLVEAIHKAAYNNNTLGLEKLCPEENTGAINRQTLVNYLSNYHTPNRMVLAGVGVDHDRLVDVAQEHFVDSKAAWPESNPGHVDQSVAQYTGGLVTVDKDLSNASLGPTPMPELAHLVIGLEGASHRDEVDFVPFCVLNMLMGGGGSFSAGGPGKGMYTRLYTHVLNRHHWMYAAQAFNHAYADSGVFCIAGSAHPQQLGSLAQVFVQELVQLTGEIEAEEFERAKTQLKSMLLMNLEARPVIFEDVARQVLANGVHRPPSEYIRKIDAVTRDDINRIAAKMLASKPSVAAIGSLENLPAFADIEAGLLDKAGRMPRKERFRLFR